MIVFDILCLSFDTLCQSLEMVFGISAGYVCLTSTVWWYSMRCNMNHRMGVWRFLVATCRYFLTYESSGIYKLDHSDLRSPFLQESKSNIICLPDQGLTLAHLNTATLTISSLSPILQACLYCPTNQQVHGISSSFSPQACKQLQSIRLLSDAHPSGLPWTHCDGWARDKYHSWADSSYFVSSEEMLHLDCVAMRIRVGSSNIKWPILGYICSTSHDRNHRDPPSAFQYLPK